MSDESETVTAQISDPDVLNYLDSVDNKSETIREALRAHAASNGDGLVVDVEGLTDDQRRAYHWLLEKTNGGDAYVSLGLAKNRLAQELSMDMDLVKSEILSPLKRAEKIGIVQRVQVVRIYVPVPERIEPEETEETSDVEELSVEEQEARLEAATTEADS